MILSLSIMLPLVFTQYQDCLSRYQLVSADLDIDLISSVYHYST